MNNIIKYKNISPIIDESCFVAKNVIVSGDVQIGPKTGIWYGCVIRGDVSYVRIGSNTNIQDNSVIHVTRPNNIANKTGDNGSPTIIGDNVTVGHNAILHACEIQSNSFVGMGALVMDQAVIEENSMLAAGAVLTPGKVVKSGELWAGNPAKYFRDLRREELDFILTSANNYYNLALEYKECDS